MHPSPRRALKKATAEKVPAAVALRVAPPRSGTGSKGPKKPAEAQPKPAPSKPVPSKPEPEAEAQSPLQKLMDRFR